MNNFIKISILLLFSSLINYSLICQNSILFQPGPEEGKDALVHTIYPNTNLGDNQSIIAAAWTYDGIFGRIRSLIQFDLTSIPPQTVIDSALLSLYYNPNCGHDGHGGANSAFIRKITGNWDEETVTWNTQPSATTTNQVFLPASITTYQDYTNINVSSMVQEMINNPAENNGFLLILETEEQYRSLIFASSDNPVSGLRPKLELFLGCRIDLGPDTLLCNDSTFTLSAGSGFMQYLWNTGETDSTINVTTSGTYWVSAITDFGCFASDTIQVDFFLNTTSINLGQDTTLCFDDNLLLQPGSGFDSYLWQDGSTEPTYLITDPGLYFVETSNPCGTYSDSIYVDFYPELELNLGSDTNMCFGQTLSLNPGIGFINYLWQDGSNLPFYDVNESGLYSLTVTNIHQCTATDEILVNFNQIPLNLGNDTSICEHTEIILNAPNTVDSILWMDSLNAQFSYSVNSAGTYWVSVFQNFGNTLCEANDTLIITIENLPHSPDLLSSYEYCSGETLTLNANIGEEFEYIWNGNIYDSSIVINEPGIQLLDISNKCGHVLDTVIVFENPKPTVGIQLTSLENPGEYILQVDSIYTQILWNTGSNNPQIDIMNPGNYTVTVWNQYGCMASDSIFIEPPACIRNIPAVFTPNADSKNDYFYIDDSYVKSFNIKILNRWGEVVFESNNSDFSWDGKKNGIPCSEGTYYYIISYTCTALKNLAQQKNITGNILLLR